MPAFKPHAKDSGKQYDLVPKGPTVARLARIIEIGQQSGKYGTQSKAVFSFSLPSHTMDIGGEKKQRFIGSPFGVNLSNNEGSTIYQYCKSLDPNEESQDLGGLLGRACQIQIAHVPKQKDGSMMDKIDSTSPLLPGLTVPPLDTEPFWFQWDKPNKALVTKIPEFIRNLMKEAIDYPGSAVEVAFLEAGV